MRNLIMFLLLGATVATAPGKACAQDAYWYGPVLFSEGWYCPDVVFNSRCYVRAAASQRVCHVPSNSCITNRWWL